MPFKIAAESSTKPIGMGPMATVGGGGSERPCTLKNLAAPGMFFGIKQLAATPLLTTMSQWILLSKVPESDLWDVVATRMTGGALT